MNTMNWYYDQSNMILGPLINGMYKKFKRDKIFLKGQNFFEKGKYPRRNDLGAFPMVLD